MSFLRSVQALNQDRFRTALLSLAAVLLAAWLGWLFLAQITRYEVSQSAYLGDENTVIASFSPAALAYLQPGQAARFYLDDFPQAQPGGLPVTASRIAGQAQAGQIEIEFTLAPGAASIPLKSGLTGRVEIEVERLSPAMLVLRAAGQSNWTP